VIGSIATDEALLALKIAFLVLLYLFIWMIVRSATRDVRTAPQESIVLSAAEASVLRTQHQQRTARAHLAVVSSPTLPAGQRLTIAEATTVGRSPECTLRLDHDEYVSSRHARITPADAGVWLEDLGSTNGTYVNGAQVTSTRLVQPGELIRIGDTQLRVEP
jgi:pSer/pThr/pTyr-binding forkhead associated (FHA) protein